MSFLQSFSTRTAILLISAAFLSTASGADQGTNHIILSDPPAPPSYLKGFEQAYAADPRRAARSWFAQARFGLFVHYGLVSLLPNGKKDPAPVSPMLEDLQRRFTADRFDAKAIADLAVAAGMRYICFTPYHGGGPYNFRSLVAHPNTVDDLPAKRDLTGEMAEACRSRGLGLFLYVHTSLQQSGDPATAERNLAIFREWLTHYGPLAGFWFDSDSNYYKDRSRFAKLEETYALIRSLQPQALISFCHGVTGDEDAITYEHRFHPQSDFKYVPDDVKKRLSDRTVEIATTLMLDKKDGRGTKMWFNVDSAYHRNADEVWQIMSEARAHGCNLLLNTGPLGDGSIHPADEQTLRAIGRRLTERGWPAPATGTSANGEGEDR